MKVKYNIDIFISIECIYQCYEYYDSIKIYQQIFKIISLPFYGHVMDVENMRLEIPTTSVEFASQILNIATYVIFAQNIVSYTQPTNLH